MSDILSGMSFYGNILDNVVSTVEELGLSWNGSLIPVSLRKLPKREERLDTLPLIIVAPSEESEGLEPASGEGYFYVFYTVEIVLIVAGNRDFTSGLEAELDIRQPLRVVFQKPTPFGPDDPVFDTDVRLEAPLDRGKLNQSYDYSGLAPRFRTCERRDLIQIP